jgi:transcriptional regulator with XRE-family HTH domain
MACNKTVMKLERYLTEKKLTAAAFGKLAGLSQSQVSRIIRGKSWPSREAVDAIFKATSGKVTAHDLYQAEAAE